MKVVAIIAMTAILTGCNTAVVITVGARKTTGRPIIATTDQQPCPTKAANEQGDDTRMAIVIVYPKVKHEKQTQSH